ncbi:MAG TPA: amino acid permease [Ignavibacteriaceae bacterium]|nr:amino acid permease [Ignavibacteriaceae bacterium]
MQKRKGQTESQPTFARDLGLFDATMIGVGAMIGAGIFVLTGIAAGEAGPASILAFALNGVVTLLTAFAYAELASAIPKAGGGYSFVKMAYPGAVGFVSGWMLWFAYTVACSLYALGFAGYFWEFIHKYIPFVSTGVFSLIGNKAPVLLVTIIIGSAFIWLNARGAEVTGKAENILTLSKLFVLGIFIYFGLKEIFGNPEQAKQSFTPFFTKGFSGVFIAMGLTFIAFEGYDLIATVAEEIKSPEINIPRATFIALGITIVMYILILFVSLAAINPGGMPSWEFLGKFKETAIVRAAENFMPAIGVALIVFGGILSTSSALNATVMAASRVAFSMGRDLWLPKRVSKIHSTRRTPHVAIYSTGAILLIMAVTLPIETVGSAASLMFLLTFALVNLSVIVLRRNHPEIPRKYKVPFYPVVPLLGFVLNIFLALYQFDFQPIAWYVTVGWIAFGLLLYYSIFEKQAATIEPQVLLPGAANVEIDSEPTVLVAIHNPDTIEILLKLAIPVAKQRDQKILAVSVVEVPRQMPIHEGMRFTHHKEALLNKAKKIGQEYKVEIETDVIIGHNSSQGILAAAYQHNASLLVMGWKGYTKTRDRIFGEIADRVIRFAPCDLMMLKIGETQDIKNCFLPTAGGPNAQLASTILNAIAKDLNLSVTAGFIAQENATHEQIETGNERIKLVLSNLDPGINSSEKIIKSKSVAGGIAKASQDYDLVVIGAAKEPVFRKMLFGEIPEKVARFSPTSVLVVKRYEGIVKNILKKVLG